MDANRRINAMMEKVLFWAITGICGLGVHFLRDLSQSVADLNLKMATVIEQITAQSGRIEQHGVKIRTIEDYIERSRK